MVNTATGTIGSIASIAAGSDIVNFGNMTDVRTSGTLVNHAGGSIGTLLGRGTRPSPIPERWGRGGSGDLQLVNNVGASISNATYAVAANGAHPVSIFNAGTISGGVAAVLFLSSGNTLTLAPTSVISGLVAAMVPGNTLQLGGAGTGSFDISALVPGFTNLYSGFTTFNKVDSSLWSLTGNSTYNGDVNVNGGTLAVNGNLAAASLLTVNVGGILGGNGTLGATAINGGTLAPGNSIGTLTIASLTMTAASTDLVQVEGTSSDRATITGTAAIAGTVSVDPLARLTSTTTYTIVNAGTLTGTFDSASVTNNFARNARLTYVGNDVLVTLDPGLLSPILPGNASINNRNVAAGIDNALEGGATMPGSFNGLFMLTRNNLLNALTQISGETTTGSQQTTFDAMTQFMGVLSDPFTAGRGGTAPAAFAFAADDALADAPDGRKRTRAERDAFTVFTKAPPRAYEGRWNVWAAGFGGSRTTDGNTVPAPTAQPAKSPPWLSAPTTGSRPTCRRFCARRWRHQFLRRQWRPRPVRSVPGRCLRPPHHRVVLHHGDRRLWLAGHQHRSSDHRRRPRAPARELQCQCVFRPHRRRQSLAGAGARRRRPDALCGTSGHGFDLPSYAETSANGAGGFALTTPRRPSPRRAPRSACAATSHGPRRKASSRCAVAPPGPTTITATATSPPCSSRCPARPSSSTAPAPPATPR